MKLVIAIDGRQSADTAIEHVLKANYGAGLQVHLIHVLVPGFADAPVEGIPDVVAQETAEATAVLGDMALILERKLGATVTTAIPVGEIAEVIADACRRFDADEAIVPSHARHGFSRLWFGSVAEQIVDAAPCAVLVLKMPEAMKQ